MMKACQRLSMCGAGRQDVYALGSGHLATAQHLCGALVGLVNPGLVGFSLDEGKRNKYLNLTAIRPVGKYSLSLHSLFVPVVWRRL